VRIFSGGHEAAREIERDMYEMGVDVHPDTVQDQDVVGNPDFDTKELVAYQYQINVKSKSDKYSFLDYFGLDKDYAHMEFLDRVSDHWLNPGSSWRARPEVWEQYLNSEGEFHYTYNERIRTQLSKMLAEAKTREFSRQLIITINDHHLDKSHWGGAGRVPCSMFYHFLVRPAKVKPQPPPSSGIELVYPNDVTLVYSMRSCDLYTHFGYDVYLAIALLEYVAKSLKCNVGSFIHVIDSLHAFRKDWKKRRIF